MCIFSSVIFLVITSFSATAENWKEKLIFRDLSNKPEGMSENMTIGDI